MKYATTTRAKTSKKNTIVLAVHSVHKSLHLAIKANGSTLGVVQVSDDVKKGDHINDCGEKLGD